MNFKENASLLENSEGYLRELYESIEGMLAFSEAVLLYRLARSIKSGCIVEIGSYRGLSTAFMARGSLDGSCIPVYAIDPHKTFIGVLGGKFGPADRTSFYKTMLHASCSEIVSLINLSSEQFADTWTEPVSLLWIDGDHTYSGVVRDFNCWNEHLRADALVAFHDATDTKIGPHRLIGELLLSGKFREYQRIENTVVLRKL